MKISVIGAGLGGLSSACLLAVKGHQVSVFEKNATVGGKMNRFEADGFRFDTGPSLLTMPEILQKLFEACKTDLSSHLDLVPLDPLCKYFYQDGTIFKNYSDRSLDLKEVENIAPQEVKAYSDFLTYSESLYKKTAPAFIFNPLFSIKDLRNLDLLSFFAIDAFTSVSNRVDSKFQSPYLRRFFKRFSTYNGSSPFQAPATLNVIPHVELNTGAFYVKGGLYKIAEALHNLALSLGVKFHFESEIEQIMVEGKKVEGVQLKSGFKEFSDLIIANSDTTETILNLIPGKSISPRKKKKMATIEPSCSGFVLMLGINKKYEQLEHHNLFFSDNYEREFEQIFKEKVMPDDPTIYIASTSHSDQNHAPAGSSNLFILVNAPYLSNRYDWEINQQQYGDKIIQELEKRGLKNLSKHVQVRENISPQYFYDQYLSNKGSIYGTSSNSMFSAFNRPRNKSREIEGLYFAGGSAHPGGGIPLVVQSAFNVLDLIERYEKL